MGYKQITASYGYTQRGEGKGRGRSGGNYPKGTNYNQGGSLTERNNRGA